MKAGEGLWFSSGHAHETYIQDPETVVVSSQGWEEPSDQTSAFPIWLQASVLVAHWKDPKF